MTCSLLNRGHESQSRRRDGPSGPVVSGFHGSFDDQDDDSEPELPGCCARWSVAEYLRVVYGE